MGGGPSKKGVGYECTSKSECTTDKCGKPCRHLQLNTWKRNPNIDHWNHMGYCQYRTNHHDTFYCVEPETVTKSIFLNADGSIDYNGFNGGSKSTWDKNQCIKNVNCNFTWKCTPKFAADGTGSTTTTSLDGCKSRFQRSGKPFIYNSGTQACQETNSKGVRYTGDAGTIVCEKPGEAAMMTNAVAQPAVADPLMVDFMAIIGLLFVLYFIFRRFFVKPAKKPAVAVPTETTALEITQEGEI